MPEYLPPYRPRPGSKIEKAVEAIAAAPGGLMDCIALGKVMDCSPGDVLARLAMPLANKYVGKEHVEGRLHFRLGDRYVSPTPAEPDASDEEHTRATFPRVDIDAVHAVADEQRWHDYGKITVTSDDAEPMPPALPIENAFLVDALGATGAVQYAERLTAIESVAQEPPAESKCRYCVFDDGSFQIGLGGEFHTMTLGQAKALRAFLQRCLP